MLVIDDVSLRVAGRLLIEHASAQIPDGARVGLVGRNGTGKSTLFRAIVGDLAVEHGRFSWPTRASIGRLPQEAPNGPEALIDIVLAGNRERSALLAEAETATDPHRIAEIQIAARRHRRPCRAGARRRDPRRARVLPRGPEAPLRRILRRLADARRARRRAVRASRTSCCSTSPPTISTSKAPCGSRTIIARYPHTVIVISHDRDLLDTAVDSILHLDRTKLTFYRGNYTSFERQRNERLALDLGLAKKQDAQRKRLTSFVERFRAKATKARQAQSRLKLLAKLQPIDVRIEDDVREISFPSPDKPLSPPIIALDDTAVGYEPGKPVLRRLTLRIDADDRIALLGANGNGKSTLTKLLTGRLAPFSGTVTRADKIKIAYFAQHQLDELNPAASAYDHVRKLMPDAPEAKVRARSGAIGFSGAMADTPVANLSGGEKARLLLGLATFEGPHLVVLDEPTNHLDIDSRGALIEAINDYTGAVILVSHDRHLLEACADRLWLVADGAVKPFDGDLDDYRRLVLGGGADSESRAAKDEARQSRADQRRAAAEKRAELAPLKKRIDAFDKTVTGLTQAYRRDRYAARRPQALRPRSRARRNPRQGARRGVERAGERRGPVAHAQRRIRERGGGLACRPLYP